MKEVAKGTEEMMKRFAEEKTKTREQIRRREERKRRDEGR